MAGPNCSAAHKADAVPDNVEVLPPVFDVFNDHALVMEQLVAILLLAAFNDGQHLFIGQALVLHWVDADMVQRFAAVGTAGDFPHFLECLVEVLGFRITKLDKARLLVLALLLHIRSGGSVSTPDMGFNDQ